MTFWEKVARLFQQPTTRMAENLEWLEREEQRQMREVRDRLERVEHHLSEIDRRKQDESHRGTGL